MKEHHIPYRNSVMTTILKDSLGGNAQTTFIATINPEDVHIAETLSSLRFMMRCAQVKTSLTKNIFDREDTISNDVDVLQKEVLTLRRLVKAKEGEPNTKARKQKNQQQKNSNQNGKSKRLVVPSLAVAELDILASKYLTRQPDSEQLFIDILQGERAASEAS